MKKPKPVSEKTRAMLDAMKQDAEAPPEGDKLDIISGYVAKLRDAELDKARLEEQVKARNIEINDLLWSKIPQVMDEARSSSFTLVADGNKPPYNIAVEDYYKANIPEAKQGEAFAYLKKRNAGDLIKTQFVISFGLGQEKAAERFGRSLDKAKIPYETKCGVPWNTLTAWFREEYKKKPLPSKVMELLGATVGRVAKVVKQKEKK